MMKKMGMKDLKNGYMVMLRNGLMGMVQGEVIVLEGGFFYIDDEYTPWKKEHEDDLTSKEDEQYDIMRVFRSEFENSRIGFEDFGDGFYSGDIIFDRDENWIRPDREARERYLAEERARAAIDQEAADGKTLDQKAADQETADKKAEGQKTADQKAIDQKAADGKTVDQKAARQETADKKAADQKTVDQKAIDQEAGARKLRIRRKRMFSGL